jgi:Ran GTPase-activating protein (RanGAP) involved in mRNA processing and transport
MSHSFKGKLTNVSQELKCRLLTFFGSLRTVQIESDALHVKGLSNLLYCISLYMHSSAYMINGQEY